MTQNHLSKPGKLAEQLFFLPQPISAVGRHGRPISAECWPACVPASYFSRASSCSLKTFILSWFSNLVAAQSDRMSALSGRMSKAAFRYSSTHRPVHGCEVAQTIQAFAGKLGSSFPPPLLSNVKQDGKNKKNIFFIIVGCGEALASYMLC